MSRDRPQHDNDPRSTDELIQVALEEFADHDDLDTFPHVVGILQGRGSREVFDAARRMSESRDVGERVLAAALLARIGGYVDASVEDCIEILLRLLRDEDPEVISTAACALGRHGGVRAIPLLLDTANHPSAEVRIGVAYALGEMLEYPLSPDQYDSVAKTLIRLMADDDRDVRYEAVDAVVYQACDKDGVTEALCERARDDDPKVRSVALLGLAYRHHPKVVDMLIHEISAYDQVYDDTLDAAAMTGDPRLLPALAEAKELGIDGYYMDAALKACSEADKE